MNIEFLGAVAANLVPQKRRIKEQVKVVACPRNQVHGKSLVNSKSYGAFVFLRDRGQ